LTALRLVTIIARLMPAPPADVVDVEVLAAEGASRERRYRLEEFERLVDVLVDPDGEAVAGFRFRNVADDLPGCELTVAAEVTLRCQRCLQGFVQALRSTTKLAFVAGDEAAMRVPEEWEAVTSDQGRVALRDLVEDELLLSLPIVALHPPGTACAEPAQQAGKDNVDAEESETHRPFAGLKDLLEQ